MGRFAEPIKVSRLVTLLRKVYMEKAENLFMLESWIKLVLILL